MLLQFKEHITANFPFLEGSKILVACSGGLDSVVLAYICANAGLDIVLVHCNFHLRGMESEQDEAFVRHLAKELDVAVVAKSFDVNGYIEKKGGSVQMAARELRYQWFSELIEMGRGKYLLTAHHADDVLETFLINLSRGTGLNGLTGIPVQNGTIIRPLLSFSRMEILNYAMSQNLEWREDSSNLDTKYLRNKIRHGVVPKLKELHPAFLDNFKHTQAHLQQTNTIFRNHITQLKEQLFEGIKGRFNIRVEALQQLKPKEGYLYALFQEYGFTEWSNVNDLLTGLSGKEVLSKTHRLIKDREYLILTEIQSGQQDSFIITGGTTEQEFPIPLKFELVEVYQKVSSNVIFVDKEKLNYPLLLRYWEKGDYFYPFGMRGKKKLSKFFKDEKVDVVSKEKQWLLCSGDHIVWVVGRRLDDRFKVDESTNQILKITLDL